MCSLKSKYEQVTAVAHGENTLEQYTLYSEIIYSNILIKTKQIV